MLEEAYRLMGKPLKAKKENAKDETHKISDSPEKPLEEIPQVRPKTTAALFGEMRT